MSGSYRKRRWGADSYEPYKRSRSEHPKYECRRDEESMTAERALSSLLFIVGDKSNSLVKKDIEDLCRLVLKDYGRHKAVVIDVLMECVSEMAWKPKVYGALVGSIHMQKNEFAGQVVSALSDSIGKFATECQWHKFVLAERFIGELVNIGLVSCSSWIRHVQPFVDAQPSIAFGNPESFLVWTVLSVLPIVGSVLSKTCPSDLDHLFGSIRAFINRRKERQSHISFLATNNSLNQDRLNNLFELVNEMYVSSGWTYDLLPSPSDMDLKLEPVDIEPMSGLKLESGTCPPVGTSFRLYLDRGTHNLPDSSHVDRWMLYEVISKTAYMCEMNRYKCVEYLKGFELAKSVDLGAAAVETLVSEMLTRSPSNRDAVYYASLLVGVVKTIPGAQEALEEAVYKIFYNLEELDHAQFLLFAEWFAHHLSSTDFKWRWEPWEKSLMRACDESNDPKSSVSEIGNVNLTVEFLKYFFVLLTRLSYYERIREVVPGYFSQWLPEPPDPNCKYLEMAKDRDGDSTQIFMHLCELMRRRASVQDVEDLLNQGSNQSPDRTAHEMFLQSLLLVGSKSLTHLTAVLERYVLLLQKFNELDSQQFQTIDVVCDFWKHNTQSISIVLFKMVGRGIVSPAIIARWIFDDQGKKLNAHHSWSLLDKLIQTTPSQQDLFFKTFFGRILETIQHHFDTPTKFAGLAIDHLCHLLERHRNLYHDYLQQASDAHVQASRQMNALLEELKYTFE